MNYRIQRILALTACTIALCFCVSMAKTVHPVRPTLCGFAPAYPKNLPPFTDQSSMPRFFREKNVLLEWNISSTGEVLSITTENPADSQFMRVFSTYFRTIPFEAAHFNGKAVDSRLVASLRLVPEYPYPYLTFPIDSLMNVTNRFLYAQSAERNDIELPQLTYFPIYWSSVRINDTFDVPPVILLKIVSDKDGKITDLKSVRSTYPAFTSQLMAAAARAVITPAKVNGQAIAATSYLYLSFFPGNNYPTLPYTPSVFATLPLRERLQITLLADTLGLAWGPIPRFGTGESITGGSEVRGDYDSIAVSLTVDSLGNAGCLRNDDIPQDKAQWIRTISNWMKFYPAIDCRGKTHPFIGTAYFFFSDSTSVRISYPWLR